MHEFCFLAFESTYGEAYEALSKWLKFLSFLFENEALGFNGDILMTKSLIIQVL